MATVEDGVKLGCGMFVVLPILLVAGCVGLVLGLGTCGTIVGSLVPDEGSSVATDKSSNVAVLYSTPVYKDTELGRSVQFEVTVRSIHERNRPGFLFVYARNDNYKPPSRNIMPPKALTELTERRNLQLSKLNHRMGFHVTIPAQGTDSKVSVSMIVPKPAMVFEDYRILVFDNVGNLVVDKSF